MRKSALELANVEKMEIVVRVFAALVLGVCLWLMTDPETKILQRFGASVMAAFILIFVV